MSQNLSLTVTDGHVLSAYAAGDPHAGAGVVILQEIFGVNAHIRSVADTYARQGYYAVAPALFDRVERGVELAYDAPGLERARALASRLTPETTLADIAAAIAHVRASTTTHRAAVVGYCLGGSYAWWSATRLQPAPDAAVGYYGSRITAHATEFPRTPVLLHFGAQDRGIPLSDVEAIRAAQPALPVHVYDAGHGFNRDGSAAYSAPAATQALERTLEFLRAHGVAATN